MKPGLVLVLVVGVVLLAAVGYLVVGEGRGYTLLTGSGSARAHGTDAVGRGVYLQRDGAWLPEAEVEALLAGLRAEVAGRDALRARVLAELPLDLVGSGIELDDVALRITDGLPEGVAREGGSSHGAVHGVVSGTGFLQPEPGNGALLVVEFGCELTTASPAGEAGESRAFVFVGARWGTAPGYRDVESLKRTVTSIAGDLVAALTAAAEEAGLTASTTPPPAGG